MHLSENFEHVPWLVTEVKKSRDTQHVKQDVSLQAAVWPKLEGTSTQFFSSPYMGADVMMSMPSGHFYDFPATFRL